MSRLIKVEKPTHIEIEGEGEDVTKLGHFRQKGVVDLREVSLRNVEIAHKSEVSIVGKLALFGDRIMRTKAKTLDMKGRILRFSPKFLQRRLHCRIFITIYPGYEWERGKRDLRTYLPYLHNCSAESITRLNQLDGNKE